MSNSKSVTADFDITGPEPVIKSVSYQTYKGNEKDISWTSDSTDVYATVSYTDIDASEALNRFESIRGFAEGGHPFLDVQDAINHLSESNLQASVKESEKHKKGFDFDFPIVKHLGLGLDLSVSFSGESSYHYNTRNGLKYGGGGYILSTSEVDQNAVASHTTDFNKIILDSVDTTLDLVTDKIVSAANHAIEELKIGFATVVGKVSGWFTSVTTMSRPGGRLQSVEIVTLMDADSGAGVSATLGDPYILTVYKDEARTIAVTDDQLAENPLTLTLEYTDDMLAAAGADPDARVYMFFYDEASDLYIRQTNGVHNRDSHTVTADVSRNGEYILAVDSAAPVFSDFTLTDQTLTPGLTVLISDMSGLASFRFWIDDGANLVTTDTINEYYDDSTGVFHYRFAAPLSEGEHTAYFLAADTLGNENTEAAAFPFEIHGVTGALNAPRVPNETIRENAPFTVSVSASAGNSFTDVSLICSTDGMIVNTVPMIPSENVWTAEVTPIMGTPRMEFTAVANDEWGNLVESPSSSVTLSLPLPITAPVIEKITFTNNSQPSAQITIRAPENQAVSGLVFVAAYDKDGRMLTVESAGVGLSPNEVRTVSVTIAVESGSVERLKSFFVTPDRLTPQSESAIFDQE